MLGAPILIRVFWGAPFCMLVYQSGNPHAQLQESLSWTAGWMMLLLADLRKPLRAQMVNAQIGIALALLH